MRSQESSSIKFSAANDGGLLSLGDPIRAAAAGAAAALPFEIYFLSSPLTSSYFISNIIKKSDDDD